MCRRSMLQSPGTRGLPLALLVMFCFMGSTLENPLIPRSEGHPEASLHLYSGAGKSATYLQINNGKVTGFPLKTVYSDLIITRLEAGFVVITGVASERYLCMDSRGTLRGLKHLRFGDCTFREKTLGNGRVVYYSPKHHISINLGKDHAPFWVNENAPFNAWSPSDQNKITLTEVGRLKRSAVVNELDPLGVNLEDSIMHNGLNPIPPSAPLIHFASPRDSTGGAPDGNVDPNDPSKVVLDSHHVGHHKQHLAQVEEQ